MYIPEECDTATDIPKVCDIHNVPEVCDIDIDIDIPEVCDIHNDEPEVCDFHTNISVACDMVLTYLRYNDVSQCFGAVKQFLGPFVLNGLLVML